VHQRLGLNTVENKNQQWKFFLKIVIKQRVDYNLVHLVQQVVAANVLLEMVKIKVNGRVSGQFLIGHRYNVIHDARNENLAFVIDQSIHHINQIGHSFVPMQRLETIELKEQSKIKIKLINIHRATEHATV